jgi:hypothetical protein
LRSCREYNMQHFNFIAGCIGIIKDCGLVQFTALEIINKTFVL